jgi:hypothetical protein
LRADAEIIEAQPQRGVAADQDAALSARARDYLGVPLDQAADGLGAACSTCGWRKMLHKRTDFAARPAIQQKTPTDAKNTAAIQTPESESLPVETAIKMISAAIQHTKAIARLHQ